MITQAEDAEEFERRLDRALECAPEVAIPDDFAARVAEKVPARVVASRQAAAAAASIGDRMAWIMAAALLVAILVLAPSIREGGMKLWVEFVLAMDFAGLSAWLGLRMLRPLR